MCISFFYINQKCSVNTFRFILIFNRDEYYDRKTKNAHFWDCGYTLAGRDMEAACRGTWLGVSKTGRVGAILNISDKTPRAGVNSRGELVTEYLKNYSTPYAYIENRRHSERTFNDYNLLLFDLYSSNITGYLHTSMNYGNSLETIRLTDGIYGISNSPLHQPFKKVIFGKEKFENVINNFNHVTKKDTLVEEFLGILKSDTQCYPDPVLYNMKRTTVDEIYIVNLSSIFVRLPGVRYGTRTHTILLVTHDMVGHFHEISLATPESPTNSEWVHNQFTFNFNPVN